MTEEKQKTDLPEKDIDKSRKPEEKKVIVISLGGSGSGKAMDEMSKMKNKTNSKK